MRDPDAYCTCRELSISMFLQSFPHLQIAMYQQRQQRSRLDVNNAGSKFLENQLCKWFYEEGEKH